MSPRGHQHGAQPPRARIQLDPRHRRVRLHRARARAAHWPTATSPCARWSGRPRAPTSCGPPCPRAPWSSSTATSTTTTSLRRPPPGASSCTTSAGAYRGSAEELHRSHADGTRNLLRALEPGTRFVYVSSTSVYGWRRPWPADESTPPRPDSAYGIAKLAAEQLTLRVDRRRRRGRAPDDRLRRGRRRAGCWPGPPVSSSAGCGGSPAPAPTASTSLHVDDAVAGLRLVGRRGRRRLPPRRARAGHRRRASSGCSPTAPACPPPSSGCPPARCVPRPMWSRVPGDLRTCRGRRRCRSTPSRSPPRTAPTARRAPRRSWGGSPASRSRTGCRWSAPGSRGSARSGRRRAWACPSRRPRTVRLRLAGLPRGSRRGARHRVRAFRLDTVLERAIEQTVPPASCTRRCSG